MATAVSPEVRAARNAPPHFAHTAPTAGEDREDSALTRAIRQCRQLVGFTLLFSACLNLLFIAPTIYMLQVYDRVVPTQGKTTLMLVTLVLVGAITALCLLDMARSRLLVRMGARIERKLAPVVLRAGLAQVPGGTASAGVRDFDTLRGALSGPAISALCDAPWTPIYVLICFVIHPWIGVLASVGVMIILLIAWYNNRATHVPMVRAANAAALAYASYDSSSDAAPAVGALGMRDARVALHLREREEMVRLQTTAALESARLASFSKLVRLLLQSLALGLGALLAIGNQISAGAIFASMFIVGRALAPIDQLLGSWKTIGQARRAFRNLADLLAKAPPDRLHTHLPAPSGSLSATGLTVEDSSHGRVALAGVGFAVEPGEVLAIIGPSGAGKSTLIRVIAGAQAASAGDVRFDGADQADWDPERLARHIGFMAQEPTLFAGTIKDNIARFQQPHDNSEALDAAVVAAAARAGAHEMILSLPGGYDYQLAPGGRGLSAGQAQQVALARALFGSPAYLLLDEPNAHLDSQADARLISTLHELKAEGVTILFVAHKLNLLSLADKILLLDQGRVMQAGPREDVLRQIAPPPRAVPQTASAA